jgi:tetratricopeptide (TPR) repeat protein
VQATTLSNIGLAYLRQGKLKWAQKHFRQALVLQEGIKDLRGQATTLNNIALAYDVLGEADLALTYFERALAMAKAVQSPKLQSDALYNMGLLKYDKTDLVDSERLLFEAVTLMEACKHPYLMDARTKLRQVRATLANLSQPQ